MDVWTDATHEVPAAVTLREVGEEAREVVERLWQLDQHDMSEFWGGMPGPDGLYDSGRLDLAFSDPERRIYLIHYGGDLAGFTTTRPLPDGATSIVGFFVVRAVRRRSVGRRAALALLRQRPGRWAIAFQKANAGAARFWRRVATEAVGTDWREERRPVPGKPQLPPDHWVLLDTSEVADAGGANSPNPPSPPGSPKPADPEAQPPVIFG